MDFTANGRDLLASCEFSGQMIVVDVAHERVVRTIDLPDGPGAMPQDVKLAPDGRLFFVADMHANGVWEIDARSYRVVRFLPTGSGAHGLYVSRNAKDLYVTNRTAGTVSVVSFDTRKIVATWQIPRRQPRHGRRLGRRQGPLALRPLQQRGLRDLDQHRATARPHPRRRRPARALRLAPTRPLLARPHRHPPLRCAAPRRHRSLPPSAWLPCASGCHAHVPAASDGGDLGRQIYTHSCSNCHTLTGHDTHASGGDLLEADLSVADLASFARTMPVTPPLTASDAEAVARYIRARRTAETNAEDVTRVGTDLPPVARSRSSRIR